MLQRVLSFLSLLVCINIATAADTPVPDTQEQIVYRFVEAFNAHDTEGMLEMVTDDIQWLSIDGEDIVTETSNKEQLRSGMADYFESCSSCQSRLVHIFSTGIRVSALEVASFETDGGVKEQQSLSVYEFSGSLIRRVYYFPAE